MSEIADVVFSARRRSIHICTYQASQLIGCPEAVEQPVVFNSE